MRRGRATAAVQEATGTGLAASAALAVLVLVCVFIAVALPRASLGYRTQVLRHILRAASAQQTAVLGDADLASLDQGYLSGGQLAAVGSRLADGLGSAGLPLAAAQSQWSGWVISTGTASGAPRPAAEHMLPPQLEILYRSSLNSNATLVAGTLPRRAQDHGTFQVAITTATAAALGLRVGSRLQAAGQRFVVSGIIRPLGPASTFWTVEPSAAAPQLTYPSRDSAPFLSSAAFISAAELPRLDLAGLPEQALWSFPLRTGQISADQAAGLLRALERESYLPVVQQVDLRIGLAAGALSPIGINLNSGLVTVLPSFVAADDAVQRALVLLFVSLTVIAAVVVMLGARLVAEHRRGEFALMRARGAALAQVASVALRGGATVVLPAACVAVVAAILATPGPTSWLAFWLAALITGTALAAPVLLALWWHRTHRDARSALRTAAARRRVAVTRRWVLDGALLCAALAGLVILRQQGLPTSGGVDLFTSMAPLLAALPVALLLVRCYPVVLRRVARLAARRRGVVMVVGLVRGSATAQAGMLPIFALILALAVVAFAGMARAGVRRADIAASWQLTGADAVVTAPGEGPGITPAAARLITHLPGVRRTVLLTVTTGTSDQGLPLSVVVVDPRQYASVAAGTPAPRLPAALLARPTATAPQRRVPALASAGGAAALSQGSGLSVAGRQLTITVAGGQASIAGVPDGRPFGVLPGWALGNQSPRPNVIAIVGTRLAPATLRRVVSRTVPGAQTTFRSGRLAAISGAPLPHGGTMTFGQGAAAAAAFSLLILLLMLVLSAQSREVTLARLMTMGLGPAQSRQITVMENLPVILAAVAGGMVCALVLVPLVAPTVSLAAFTGTAVRVPLRVDPATLTVAAGGLLVLAAVTLLIQNALARRLGPGQVLRVGQ